MKGTQHKAIGVATGLACTIYGVAKLGNPMYALMTMTSGFGAMLPDIDHNATQLGKKRKAAENTIATIIKVVCISIISIIAYEGYCTGSFQVALVKLLVTGVPMALMYFITTNPKVKQRTKFLRKHRGIWHTLLVPAVFLFLEYNFDGEYLIMLIKGLNVGYISHLFADMLTPEGCPILWPLTTKNISLLKIDPNSTLGQALVYLICGGEICLALYLTR